MFGDRLKLLRNEKNMTQKNLADLLNVSPSTIGMYERNQRDPDTATLRFLADYFSVSADYLLDRTNYRQLYSVTAESTEDYMKGLDDDEVFAVKKMIEMLKKNK